MTSVRGPVWGSARGQHHLVDEGQVTLDGGLVVFPLLPQLPAQLLLRFLDPPDSEVTLLCLRGHRQEGVLGPAPVLAVMLGRWRDSASRKNVAALACG